MPFNIAPFIALVIRFPGLCALDGPFGLLDNKPVFCGFCERLGGTFTAQADHKKTNQHNHYEKKITFHIKF
jgi:hypothetical protein